VYIEVNWRAERQIGGTVLLERCANYCCESEGFVRKKLGSEEEKSVRDMISFNETLI
jgi:hypothetical protein